MQQIIYTELNHIAYVKLHRPEIRNAFNPEMILEITECFLKISQRQDLKAVVLQGEGKVFCAGADLTWMQDMVNFDFQRNVDDSNKLFAMFQAIDDCPIPVLGFAQGAAFGGALGLIACCDYVIAEEKTQFCFSEVKLGIAPAVISAFILKKISRALVAPYMISAKVFNENQALQMGLVHEVCLTGEGHHQIQHFLHQVALCGPLAVRETKKLIKNFHLLDWEQQKKVTTELIAKLRTGAEGQDGLQSFLNKKSPSWVEG